MGLVGLLWLSGMNQKHVANSMQFNRTNSLQAKYADRTLSAAVSCEMG
jgi:hypothetical protein